VDAAPILERAWAGAAGLGFGGKNTVQFLPGRTSWLLLAVLFLDLDLAPDPPTAIDHCGSCRRCLEACPTGALVAERDLDSRRCISYWTIENRGTIPEGLRPAFGRWVFGCDACQEVCPHDAAPPDPEEDDFRPRHAWLDLAEILDTPDEALARRFEGTPIRRPGPPALKRNACVVLGNLRDRSAIPVLERAARGPDALVAEHARWALGRL
jgi:epoxyqueuosine reductase